MENKNEPSSCGSVIDFCVMLMVALIVLRLCNVISWPLWVVLSPLWVPLVIVAVIIIAIAILASLF